MLLISNIQNDNKRQELTMSDLYPMNHIYIKYGEKNSLTNEQINNINQKKLNDSFSSMVSPISEQVLIDKTNIFFSEHKSSIAAGLQNLIKFIFSFLLFFCIGSVFGSVMRGILDNNLETKKYEIIFGLIGIGIFLPIVLSLNCWIDINMKNLYRIYFNNFIVFIKIYIYFQKEKDKQKQQKAFIIFNRIMKNLKKTDNPQFIIETIKDPEKFLEYCQTLEEEDFLSENEVKFISKILNNSNFEM